MPATTEEDSSFSEFMLRWLDEGDRLHENPAPTGPSVDLRRKRSWRLLITGASVVILAVVVRFVIYDMNRPIGSASQAAVAPSVAPAAVNTMAAMVAPVVSEGAPTAVPAAAPVAAVEAPIAVAATELVAPEPAPQARAAIAVVPAAAAPILVPTAAPIAVTEKPAPPPSEAPVAVAPKAEAVVVAAAEPAAARPVALAAAAGAEATAVPAAAAVPAPEAPAAALAASPVDFESLAARCREATARGRWGVARSACGAAREARPDSPDVLTRLAEIALNRGQGRQALRLANSALASDPAFADAYVIVGSVEQEAKRVEQARAAYERYLQLAPSGRFASDLRAILATL